MLGDWVSSVAGIMPEESYGIFFLQKKNKKQVSF
jgi:hypothetical protein